MISFITLSYFKSDMSSTCCLKYSQPYCNPRLLSCCHSFCTQCIQSLITEGTETNSLTCPSCQQTTYVPNGGVTSLPCNLHLINKQSDILSKIASNPPPPCDSCGKDPAIVYCTECTDLLCKQCWDAHQMVRLTRTHYSFTLEEAHSMSQDSLAKMIPSSSCTCQDHTDQQLDFYCQQCAIPICVKCIVINHKEHPVSEVSKQADKNKQAIFQCLEGFQVAQQQLNKFLISGEEVKGMIKACKNEVDTIIRQTFANLQQLLHQPEEALLAQSNEVANAKEVRLSLQLEGIQCLLETITHCQRFATTAIGEYNDVELLSVAHTLQTRANQLQQQFSETSLELSESPTISVNINTDELVTNIANLGAVLEGDISPTYTTAKVPSCVEVGKELNVKVISRDNKGKELFNGGAIVSGRFIPIGTTIQAKTTDFGDGTYLISLTPQQFGRHKLSLTVHGQSIQGSPFNSFVSRDYTTIKNPVQTITGINKPQFIAISESGDIFVTSWGSQCIHVYDNSGREKTIIGSKNGPLHFNLPSGIAICGDVMYVAENRGNKIHKLTLGGELLSTFGCKGSSNGRLSYPWGICIGPDSKIYVAEYGNNRVQVFHCDETFSHVINGNVIGDGRFQGPEGLSFDHSGHLYVTGYKSDTVTVFTSEGQYVRHYDQSYLSGPCGIAIDLAGELLVANAGKNSLAIFNPNCTCIELLGELDTPIGVAVAHDGSVWVADRGNHRLVKY